MQKRVNFHLFSTDQELFTAEALIFFLCSLSEVRRTPCLLTALSNSRSRDDLFIIIISRLFQEVKQVGLEDSIGV